MSEQMRIVKEMRRENSTSVERAIHRPFHRPYISLYDLCDSPTDLKLTDTVQAELLVTMGMVV